MIPIGGDHGPAIFHDAGFLKENLFVVLGQVADPAPALGLQLVGKRRGIEDIVLHSLVARGLLGRETSPWKPVFNLAAAERVVTDLGGAKFLLQDVGAYGPGGNG